MTISEARMAQLRAQISARQPHRREIAKHTRQRMRPVTDDTARSLTVHDVSEPDDHPLYSELAHADEAAKAAIKWERQMALEGRFKIGSRRA